MSLMAKGIQQVTKFSESVIDALPGKNAAADNILPFLLTLFSSFQYLAEVWPQEGLSEKTTYILAIYSSAALYFASGIIEEDENDHPNDSLKGRQEMQH